MSNRVLCGTGWFDPSKCEVISNPKNPDDIFYITPKGSYIRARVDGYYEHWTREKVIEWVGQNGVSLTPSQEDKVYPPDTEL